MLAVLANNLELVELLIGRGANLNARENEGSTPFIVAAANDFTDILISLADHGANQDARNF
jgi:ankyrin repeat protein